MAEGMILQHTSAGICNRKELSVPAPDYMHTHKNGLFMSRKSIQKTK